VSLLRTPENRESCTGLRRRNWVKMRKGRQEMKRESRRKKEEMDT
jgi:hypothetical protein